MVLRHGLSAPSVPSTSSGHGDPSRKVACRRLLGGPGLWPCKKRPNRPAVQPIALPGVYRVLFGFGRVQDARNGGAASRSGVASEGGSRYKWPLTDAQIVVEEAEGPGNVDCPGTNVDDKNKLWKAAVKLPMYWVAAIPVLVGAALAFQEAGAVSVYRTGGFLVAAVLIIAWLNLSNDVFDSETGVDEHKRESVVNLTGKPGMVFLTSLAFFGVGVGLLGWLLVGSSTHQSAVLLAGALTCGYVYHGPPFRLGYIGLGEPLCFLAFGPLAVQAFSLALSPQGLQQTAFGAASWWASILVGLTTTVILFCSHFHQLEGDRAVGKMSPIVRLGSTEKAHHVLRWLVSSLFVLAATGVFLGHLPWTILVALPFCTPQARDLLAFAEKHYSSPEGIRPLKMYALKLHSAAGLGLACALAASRLKLPLGV